MQEEEVIQELDAKDTLDSNKNQERKIIKSRVKGAKHTFAQSNEQPLRISKPAP